MNEDLFKTGLIRPIGGNRMVHVINCEYIRNWNIEGCTALDIFKPSKMAVCPNCETLVYIASGAKDYVANRDKYKRIVNRFGIYPKLIYNLVFGSKCKMELVGERLYIRKKRDLFYIDFNLDEVKLFHNNYSEASRKSDKMAVKTEGFHEHILFNTEPDERFKEAIRQIIKYKYEEAKKTHEQKKNKRPKIIFDQLDQEYWGFSS